MKNQQKNKQPMDAPLQDAGTVSASIPDVQHVRNSIERCLKLYMNRDEVVNTLLTRENIHPIFTNTVWERLEEENKKKFTKNLPVPPKIHVAPIPNRVHPKAPAMRYPVQQHPQMHVPSHPHVVKGVHAPEMRYPVQQHPQIYVPGHPHVVKEKNKQPMDAPIQDAGTVSASSNGSKKVSRQDIERVQNLIERCLMLYMTKNEVVKTLLTKARIHPEFTRLVWQKLEEENKEFFRAYYIRLKLKKKVLGHPQVPVPAPATFKPLDLRLNSTNDMVITVAPIPDEFNQLFEHQSHLMENLPKLQVAPIPNGVHPKAPEMRYPVQQHPQMHVPGHPHVVQGVPALANLQPLRMNSTNDMVNDTTVDNATTPQVIPPSSSGGMSEKAVSPASVASDMVMDTSMVDSHLNLPNLEDFDIGSLDIDLGSPYLPSDSQLQEYMDMLANLLTSDEDKP